MDQDAEGRTAYYRSRSLAWSIRCDDHQLRGLLDEIFADLEVPAAVDGVHFDVRSAREPGKMQLTRDASTQGRVMDSAEVADHLIRFLNHGVLEKATKTVDLHASAMTAMGAGLTVVATAASGGGKTTVAAALCRAGWSYLSDETVGIDLNDGSLIGCGKPLTVKPGLHAALGVDLEPLTIGSQQRCWYVRPGLLGGSVVATAPPPSDLVFIDFVNAAAATELNEVPPHQALSRLLSTTYRLDRHAPLVLSTLARLVANARRWELRTGDIDQAIAQLVASASSLPRPNDQVQQATSATRVESIGPMPAPGVAFAGFAGHGAVVHDYVRSEILVLDVVGAAVWQLLDGTVSVGDVTGELADYFDAPHETIAGDVEALCADLAAQGFLVEGE